MTLAQTACDGQCGKSIKPRPSQVQRPTMQLSEAALEKRAAHQLLSARFLGFAAWDLTCIRIQCYMIMLPVVSGIGGNGI